MLEGAEATTEGATGAAVESEGTLSKLGTTAGALGPLLGDAAKLGAGLALFSLVEKFIAGIHATSVGVGAMAAWFQYERDASPMDAFYAFLGGTLTANYVAIAHSINKWDPGSVLASWMALGHVVSSTNDVVDAAKGFAQSLRDKAGDAAEGAMALVVGDQVAHGTRVVMDNASAISRTGIEAGFDALTGQDTSGDVADLHSEWSNIVHAVAPDLRTDSMDAQQNADNWEEVYRRGEGYLGLNRPFLEGLRNRSTGISGGQFWSLWDSIYQAVEPVSIHLWRGLVRDYTQAMVRDGISLFTVMHRLTGI